MKSTRNLQKRDNQHLCKLNSFVLFIFRLQIKPKKKPTKKKGTNKVSNSAHTKRRRDTTRRRKRKCRMPVE